MISLPALAEADLRDTIEGEFGIPVILIDPAGSRITETVDGRPLTGKVRWSQPTVNADGESVAVAAPVVTLRRSSLAATPAKGWAVVIPEGPRKDSPSVYYSIDPSSAVDGGRSLGKIRLPLIRMT
jgi:hypothetical protein